MTLIDTFNNLGNTIINLVKSKTQHKQNQLIAGDGIRLMANSGEKNANIYIHPDVEAAFQSVIDDLNMEALGLPLVLLEDIASGSITSPKEPFIASTNLTEIPSTSRLSYSIKNNNYVTHVKLSNLQRIAAQQGLLNAFQGCTSLISADLSNLRDATGENLYQAFAGCTSLTSVDFRNLLKVHYSSLASTFRGCTNLTSVDFSSLQQIGEPGFLNTFQDCTSLKSLSFPALRSASFENNARQNCFYNMLQGVTGCTVHFPSNLESVIGQWNDVLDGFGGTDTVVLFDLPASESLLNFIIENPNVYLIINGEASGKLTYVASPEKLVYYACMDLNTGIILFGTTNTGAPGTITNISPDFTQKGYTIKLNVGTSGASALGLITSNTDEPIQQGEVMLIEKTPGVYQAKIIGDYGGMHFVYQIADETTGAVATNIDNPMITTGEDITIDVILTQS